MLLAATKHFRIQDRTYTHIHRKKRESIRLQWVLQKEAVSSRCHRWRKSTVIPRGASHPSVGEGLNDYPFLTFVSSLLSCSYVLLLFSDWEKCWLGHSFSSCCMSREWVHCTVSHIQTCVMMNSLHRLFRAWCIGCVLQNIGDCMVLYRKLCH